MKIKIFLSLVFLLGLVSFQSPKVLAQESAEGLTVSPPILELTLKPGESVNQVIKLSNPTGNLIEIYPSVMNFEAKGDGGEPTFYDSSDQTIRFALSTWLKFSQSKIALEKNQNTEFNYQITVPSDAEAGGHYGVVFFSTEPPKINEQASQVAISSKIGSLILIKVPGAIVEKAYLEQFFIKRLNLKRPINFDLKISNVGNVHFKPKGEIKIKNWRGAEVVKIPVNQKRGNILPDSVRKFVETWPSESLPFWKAPWGRFRASLNLSYGESEKTLSSEMSFWIIPIWIMVLFGLGLVVLGVIIWLIIRRKRRNKRKKIFGE